MVDVKILKEACEDILYEILMLEHSSINCLKEDLSPTDHKFFLDSFIIHFRCLYCFYYYSRNPRHPNDILASDYLLENYKLFQEVSKKEKLVNDQKVEYITKADRQVAHITSERRSLKLQNGWPIEEIKPEMDNIMQAFFKFLPDAKKKWFKNTKKPEHLPIPEKIEKLFT